MQNQQLYSYFDSDSNMSDLLEIQAYQQQQQQQQLLEEEEEEDKSDNSSNQLQTIAMKKLASESLPSSTSLQNIYSHENESKEPISIQFIIKPTFQTSEFTIDIFSGLQITGDGVIRYFPTVQPVYFGFNQKQVSLVEDLSQQGIVNIKYSRNNKLHTSSYPKVLEFISKIPGIQHQQAIDLISHFGGLLDTLSQYFSTIQTSEEILSQKDEEFQKFNKMCISFLSQYQKQYPNKMFSYSILRVSQKYNDIDMSNYGYSKAYLELLGINSETLSQLIFRGKQIDLMPQKLDITNQTLQSLSRMGQQEVDDSISEIVTFDGFPLKLYQSRRDYAKLFNSSCFFEGEYEYYFMITEMDIELYDLEQLIHYRQRLMHNQNLSYDDFLRKELSYLFEDVEYSFHSQNFMEKYYSENIKLLQQKQANKQCNYKLIN